MAHARYITIEGGDGSGKATQTKLLVDYLKSKNEDVLTISFPRYGKPSARIVERYLNGEYGAANDVPADLAALAYAIDRADREDLSIIAKQLSKPSGYIVTDRSVASNMAHQGAKFDSKERREQFYREILELEYKVLGEPKPELNIVLFVNPDTSQRNVDKKPARSYTKNKRDIHEADVDHLRTAIHNYQELCQLFPKEFVAIECSDQDGNMRPIDDIQAEIREIIGV